MRLGSTKSNAKIMAPKMEVRDKTFTAARRQGGKATRRQGSGVTTQNRQRERREQSMEQSQKSHPSRSCGWVKVTVRYGHDTLILTWKLTKKSNKNGSMYIILHHCTSIWGMLQKCSGLSEIFLRLTSRTHLWDCRRLQIPRRSCENVCRFHQHHATL